MQGRMQPAFAISYWRVAPALQLTEKVRHLFDQSKILIQTASPMIEKP
jgi:hypothetical protein